MLFEEKGCADCPSFHDKVFNHHDVLAELGPYTVVRLDTESDAPITDINGNKSSARKWARSLNISHRPGLVLFNEGKEQSRSEGGLFHFHFKEMLRYVSGKHYQQYELFGGYLRVRQPELLDRGINIDIGE